MQCPYCGNQNRPGVKFCARCGKPLPPQPAAAPPPAYQPPPAPPPPVPVPPPLPAAQSPVATPPGTTARRIQWKNIAIGCSIYLLGMLCGALILAGVLYGPDLLKGVIPASSSSPTPQTPAPTLPTLPKPSPTPPQKPGTPTPKPFLWVEPEQGSICVETSNVSDDVLSSVYTNATEHF